MQISAGKVLFSVFWDMLGILFIDYLEKGRTMNSEYYIALLVDLNEEINKKQPQMKKEKVLFHHDSTPCHKSIAMMAKLCELHFELLPHPPYPPDLVSRDYWLFADLRKILQGKRFDSSECWNSIEWRSNIGNWGIFWGQRQIVLQKKHWIVREALESVFIHQHSLLREW